MFIASISARARQLHRRSTATHAALLYFQKHNNTTSTVATVQPSNATPRSSGAFWSASECALFLSKSSISDPNFQQITMEMMPNYDWVEPTQIYHRTGTSFLLAVLLYFLYSSNFILFILNTHHIQVLFRIIPGLRYRAGLPLHILRSAVNVHVACYRNI